MVVDQVTLRDGSSGWVWPLLPSDREELIKAFDELSPESRKLRFLTPVQRLSDSMLHHLIDEVDGVDHIALVLFVETAHEVEPIAIGRIVRYGELPDAADIAVTVKDAWQGHGAATALLDLLVQKRPEGVTRLITEVALDNPPSMAMLRRLGPVRTHDAGDGINDVEVDLCGDKTFPSLPPTPRLHRVLATPERAALRSRDLLCPWLRDPDQPGTSASPHE